jgi:hypothetical protein
MGDFFQIIAAGPFFFVSSWLLRIFAGIIGVRPFGYVTSMVVTIGLWVTLAPAAGEARAPPGRRADRSSLGLPWPTETAPDAAV